MEGDYHGRRPQAGQTVSHPTPGWPRRRSWPWRQGRFFLPKSRYTWCIWPANAPIPRAVASRNGIAQNWHDSSWQRASWRIAPPPPKQACSRPAHPTGPAAHVRTVRLGGPGHARRHVARMARNRNGQGDSAERVESRRNLRPAIFVPNMMCSSIFIALFGFLRYKHGHDAGCMCRVQLPRWMWLSLEGAADDKNHAYPPSLHAFDPLWNVRLI